MRALLGTIVCKFGSDPATSVVEVAICAKVYRQTDGQTDRQTDRRRTPRDCISSMEWAKKWLLNGESTVVKVKKALQVGKFWQTLPPLPAVENVLRARKFLVFLFIFYLFPSISISSHFHNAWNKWLLQRIQCHFSNCHSDVHINKCYYLSNVQYRYTATTTTYC